VTDDAPVRIRKHADAEFLAGLKRVRDDASKSQELRDRAARMAAKFQAQWIDAGRSGDPMTPEERVYFHTP
jgi:hypothetical protein